MDMSDERAAVGTDAPMTVASRGSAFRPADQLMIEYMNEHYEAARHHQTLRAETAALMTAAATFLFGKAFSKSPTYPVDYLGYALLAVGMIAFVANRRFHGANRLHSETATVCRKLLAKTTGENDPVWVREAVKRAMNRVGHNPKLDDVLEAAEEIKREKAELIAAGKQAKKPPKIEDVLSIIFDIVPLAILAAGILVIVGF
jgi:hypothetical protein